MGKTLIVGIGNQIRGDDAIGLHIADILIKDLDKDRYDVVTIQQKGLVLLDIMRGYEKFTLLSSSTNPM